MQKMAAGESYDLVMISSTELDELIRQGKIVSGSRVDLAKSGIGVAVRAGAPQPDISSGDALKKTLLAAKTVGYTSGPSGVYMAQLVERMGIAADVKAKFRSVPSGGTDRHHRRERRCGIGFQQVSELVHIPGIDYIGPLPAEVQRITVFSCGVQTGAPQPAAAKALVAVPDHAHRGSASDARSMAWNGLTTPGPSASNGVRRYCAAAYELEGRPTPARPPPVSTAPPARSAATSGGHPCP